MKKLIIVLWIASISSLCLAESHSSDKLVNTVREGLLNRMYDKYQISFTTIEKNRFGNYEAIKHANNNNVELFISDFEEEVKNLEISFRNFPIYKITIVDEAWSGGLFNPFSWGSSFLIKNVDFIGIEIEVGHKSAKGLLQYLSNKINREKLIKTHKLINQIRREYNVLILSNRTGYVGDNLSTHAYYQWKHVKHHDIYRFSKEFLDAAKELGLRKKQTLEGVQVEVFNYGRHVEKARSNNKFRIGYHRAEALVDYLINE